MAGTTIKGVDERYAAAVESINQRLEKLQTESNTRLAAIETNLVWIIRIGGFIGASILAVVASLLYMSNRAGHVEEAVATLQGESKRFTETAAGLQGETKRLTETAASLQGETKRLTEAVATLQTESKNQQGQIARVLSVVETLERRSAKAEK
jgi:predicted nuclease with TOPRIM domain